MDKTLDNLNILITRAEHQSLETIRELEALGAKVLSFPTIKISTVFDNEETNYHIRNINKFNTLIFTSENSVRSFIRIIKKMNIEFDPQAYFVISIGDKTSRICSEYGFRIDFQSNIFASNNLIKELEYLELVGRKILIPSNLSNPEQFKKLEELGASVISVTVYANSANIQENLTKEIGHLSKINMDLYIFTSPSTFNGFLDILDISNPKEYFSDKRIAVIGPVTKKAINEYGIEPNIIPENFTMNFLIEEIKKYYKSEKTKSNLYKT